MPVGRDPGDGRRDQRPADRQPRWAPTGTRCCSSRASYGTDAEPLQMKVGYYTEVAGLGASPADVDDQRQDRGLQPVPGGRRDEQLPRAGQLLADAVQPDPAGSTPPARTAAAPRPTSGPSRRPCRCAGSSVTGGTLSLMDYCTAGPQYASGGYIADSRTGDRDQRLAAAVADPQQHDRQLVQRRLEPGLRRRRGRPDGRDLPDPAVHDARHHPAEPGEAVPLRRRRRSRTRSACRPRSATARGHHLGRRA